MRIFITGAKGQLGMALQAALDGHTLTLVDLPELDITDRQQLAGAVRAANPELVIHCAAYTDVDGAARNPGLAYRVNGLGTQHVALACQETGAALMHVSSNEVFAGKRYTGYAEWMATDPINPYGHSKAAAEFHVRHLCPRHYIVRTAWLYALAGRNFIHAILQRARAGGGVRVVTDEIGNPTYASDLANAMVQLMHTQQYGTYHLTNQGSCSRWEFANEILRLGGLDDVPNVPILSVEFQRSSSPPLFGALQNNAAAALGIELRSWREALRSYMDLSGDLA